MLALHRLARRRSSLTCALATVATLLVLVHIGLQLVKFRTGHDHIFGLIPLFDVNSERNIPTLFSALLLLFSAVLLTFISKHEKQQKSADASKWTVLALGFLYMTVDEYGQLHELLVAPGRNLLGDRPLGIFYYAWVIPGAAIVLALAVYLLGFLLRLPAKTRRAFFVAAALFIGGAVGLELLEGVNDELYGVHNATNFVLITVEESLEMAGVIVFIDALLRYVIDNHVNVTQLGAGTLASPLAAFPPVRRDSA